MTLSEREPTREEGGKRFPLHWQILSALVLATLTAAAFRGLFPEEAPRAVQGVMEVSRLVGDLFLRALKMIIVPLIVTSVVGGISGLKEASGFGRLGLKTLGFYMGTGLLAILLGLVLVSWIGPGLGADGKPNPLIREAFEQGMGVSEAEKAEVAAAAGHMPEGKGLWESVAGIFRSMIPENVFGSAASNDSVLGVLVFSILFAVAITKVPEEQGDMLKRFFDAAAAAVRVLVHGIMMLAPIGVYALILPVVYQTGFGLFANLGKYVVTVVLALGLHLFVTMPLVLALVARVNPWRHFEAMKPALLMAFSTSSSAATLPLTMECVQERAGVSSKVASFTLPIGTSINTDGTALYECVAVMFVAQVMGVQMGLAEMFFVVVAALLTSVGIAGVPHASLVAILLILKNSGVPGGEAAVGVLLAVDRFLDMSRTAVNVFGDSCVAVLVERTEAEMPGEALAAE